MTLMENMVYHWRVNDWTGHNFTISDEHGGAGKLSFHNAVEFRARYHGEQGSFTYTPGSFSGNEITLVDAGQRIGLITMGVFKPVLLTLHDGRSFRVSTGFFRRNVVLHGSDGKNVLELRYPALNSAGYGTIAMKKSGDGSLTDMLVPTALYISNLSQRRIVRLIPLLMAVMLILSFLAG